MVIHPYPGPGPKYPLAPRFDTFSKNFGGSGKKFDWKRLKGFNKKKFLLSGGIDINSVDEINNIKNENI